MGVGHTTFSHQVTRGSPPLPLPPLPGCTCGGSSMPHSLCATSDMKRWGMATKMPAPSPGEGPGKRGMEQAGLKQTSSGARRARQWQEDAAGTARLLGRARADRQSGRGDLGGRQVAGPAWESSGHSFATRVRGRMPGRRPPQQTKTRRAAMLISTWAPWMGTSQRQCTGSRLLVCHP